MSLGALRLISNISDPQRKSLLDGFYSKQPELEGINFRNDINALEFFPVRPAANPAAGNYWDTVLGINPAYLKLGIGDSDGLATGGTFDLSWDGEGDVFSELAYNISAADLQAALDAGTNLTAAGGGTVELLATGAYQFTFNDEGERDLFAGDPSGLQPECNVSISYLVEGDVDTKCVQLIQIIQRPLVFVTSWTDLGGAVATVTELRAGDVDAKALFQITFNAPYAGTYSVDGSSPISFDDISQTSILAALGEDWGAAIASIGSLTIERADVGIYTLDDSDIDVSALSVYRGFRGKLNFNSTALFKRFLEEEDEFTVPIQIRYDDGTYRETLHFSQVTLTKDILAFGALAPSNFNGFYLTEEQVMARFTENLLTINGLTGGGADDLDAIPTTDVSVPRLVQVVISDSASTYLLREGTEAEAAPGIIRPDDYAGGTNEKVYVQVD